MGSGLLGAPPCCGGSTSEGVTICYAYPRYIPPTDVGQIGYNRTSGAGVGESGIATSAWQDDVYKYANRIYLLDRLNGARSVAYSTVFTIPPAGETIDCRGLTLEQGDEIRFRTRTWNNTNSTVQIGSETLTTGTTAWQWTQPYNVGTDIIELPVNVAYDTTGRQNDGWQVEVYVNGQRQQVCDDWFSLSGGASQETVEAVSTLLPDGTMQLTIDGVVAAEGSDLFQEFTAKRDAGVLLAVPCGLVGSSKGAITKTMDPRFPADGEAVTFTVGFDVIQNDDSYPVVVRDVLADNFTVVSASSTVGTVTTSGQEVTVDLGAASEGTAGTLTIQATKVGSDENHNEADLEFNGIPLSHATISSAGDVPTPPADECDPGLEICAPYTDETGTTVASTYRCIDGALTNEFGDTKPFDDLMQVAVPCCEDSGSSGSAGLVSDFNSNAFASVANGTLPKAVSNTIGWDTNAQSIQGVSNTAWRFFADGNGPLVVTTDVLDLSAVDPSEPIFSNFRASEGGGGANAEVYVTDDGGATWTVLSGIDVTNFNRTDIPLTETLGMDYSNLQFKVEMPTAPAGSYLNFYYAHFGSEAGIVGGVRGV